MADTTGELMVYWQDANGKYHGQQVMFGIMEPYESSDNDDDPDALYHETFHDVPTGQITITQSEVYSPAAL
jgi:hypothetical protein